FEQARIEYTATLTGVRGTRLAQGDVAPSMQDTLNIVFPDTVSKPYAHTSMRIPYRSLVPREVENLLVAGRCLSADPEEVGMLRLIPPCFATGHSAGMAAALALSAGCSPRALDVGALQRAMARDGMDLGL
ncbi:MAG: FAD-dependent oxidoreductase, partial [Dehalococcoidia bacterium]